MATRETYENGVLVLSEEIPDVPQQRMLYPFQFVSLLTHPQIVAIQTSTDPTVIVLRSKLQTVIDPLPFDVGTELYAALQYLAFVLPEAFTESEFNRIVNMELPA